MTSAFIWLLTATLMPVPVRSRVSAATPQMGWDTWNTFGSDYNESVIEKTADALVSTGLRDAGYVYVILDGGWQALQRDSNGRQQPNATKFPNGIAAVADMLHSKGLKIGIYSDAGILDCNFSPGSYGNEELDAQTYADWGIDYLKYDNCGGFEANTLAPQDRFGRMQDALVKYAANIYYALCQWGNQFPWFWADQIGQSYRISGDIHSSFSSDSSGVCKTAYCLNMGYAGVSVLTLISKMRELTPFQGPDSWADMDMLEIGTGTMTSYEEQTHQSFWAALKSPLIIGADVTNINQSSLDILLNKEIIAISQDLLGSAANYAPSLSIERSTQVWIGELSGSRMVILALNEGSSNTTIVIPLSSVSGLDTRRSYSIRNVWAAENIGSFSGGSNLTLTIASHQTVVLVVS